MNSETEAELVEYEPALDPSHPLALCPCCLAGNAPWWNFCHDCGAPQSLIAATAPFERVWAMGFVIRSAVARPWCLRIVIPVMLYGFHLVLAGLSFIYIAVGGGFPDGVASLAGALAFGLATTLCGLSLLWQVVKHDPNEREGKVGRDPAQPD